MLIDVEGGYSLGVTEEFPDGFWPGYSARTLYLAHMNRTLFIQDRPFYDWTLAQLTRNMHYIPVKRDLSDLVDKILWARANPRKTRQMTERRLRYVGDNFSRDKAVERVVSLLYELLS
jgi:Glycosyl transferase family 90